VRDSTLVIWSGEFGWMPVSRGGNGRDHNPKGFPVWMAGAGIKGGTNHGATDAPCSLLVRREVPAWIVSDIVVIAPEIDGSALLPATDGGIHSHPRC
jgi:hypothetical protein